MKSSKSPPVKQPAKNRVRIALIALVIYSVVGFLILPAIIKWQLTRQLPGLTHRHATVDAVKMNPFALSLAVRGLSLKETNGEPFAAFDELYVNFQLSSIFRRAWTFSEIKLTHPSGNVVRDAQGRFNFENLFTNAPAQVATNESKALPVVIVDRLIVTNGIVTITDQTRAKPFNTAYGPVDIELKDFTTQRDRNEPYSFVATTGDGEKFAWSGKISVNPPRSAGEFKLLGIPLRKYSPYLAEIARIDLTDGVFGVSANYRLDANAVPLELEVTNAAVTLSNLEVKAQTTGETLLTLNHFYVTNASATLAGKEARAPLVAIDGGAISVRRETNGQLNWLALLVAPGDDTPTALASNTNAPATTELPWKAFLDEFKVERFAVTAEDRTTATPLHIGLDDVNLNIKGISNLTNATLTADLSFGWRAGGSVKVAAKGTLLPSAGEAKLSITDFALPPIQPYLEQQTRLLLNAGDLSVDGLVRYTPDTTPLFQFAGDVSVARFATMETVTFNDFLKWDDLSLRGIQLSLQTNGLSVEEIKFTKLETSLVVSSNGQLSVQGLIREQSSTDTNSEVALPTAPTSKNEATPFPIQISALVFEKASVRAADQSLTPRFHTSIEEFDGTIRDITLPGLTRATVDLHGKVSALAPFDVVGTIVPDATNPFVDLKLTFKNSDLTPFDPYSGKFVGRPLNKGKLTFDLHYLIENRTLKAENVIAIDQLTFGTRNGNTNATQLPVKLAVSLLKDRNGRIDLDIPLSGSLDDPQFGVGALVMKAIVNILTKVATSPFSLLGAMFGGNGEELQSVDFAPGDLDLAAGQTNRLDKLSKALYERPELNLEISASVDPASDSESIARKKLQDKLKSLYVQELTVAGKPVPTADQFKFQETDYDRVLRMAYTEAFGTLPEGAKEEVAVPQVIEAPVITNAVVPAKIAVSRRPRELVKGATALMTVRLIESTPAPEPAVQTVPTNTPPVSITVPEEVAMALPPSLRSELEQRLMAASPATEDDLRELMQRRAESVQKFLLATGRVTPDRLFLVAPKKTDPAVKGVARVTFSLD